MVIYIIGVIVLIKRHLKKVDDNEDKILLVNRYGELNEVSADEITDMEDEILV